MAITPAAGYQVDPNNPNGVIRSAPVDNTATPLTATTPSPLATAATSPAPVPTSTATPTQTPKPQTTFSSDQGAAAAADNTQNLQTLKNTGLTVGPDGLARYSDASFATAPSDAVQTEDGTWQSGGVKYALGPSTTTDPALQQINDQITQMKAQFDSTSRAAIDNIQQQFQNLIKQQTDVNTRSTASLDQSLLMGGSSRYAQESSTGQHTALMSYGLQQLADLNQKEQAAVIGAQQAQDAGDMKLMDQQITLAQKARDDKQAAAQKLSDALTKANGDLQAKKTQNAIDQGVAEQIANGVTDPAAIVKALSAQGLTISAKDVADSLANLNPDAKAITDLMSTAAKNGASPDILKAIGASKNVADALRAAGTSLVDPTTPLGQYQTYAQQAQAKGLTPMSVADFQSKNKANEAYSVEAAQKAADAKIASSDTNQQKLEQEYRGVLTKEFSARTGALGIENGKVAQANHLNSMFQQYYDPSTGDYNIPTAQYAELAIGLANMISPSGQSSDADRAEIKSKTAAGDLQGALQYVTGQPQNGNTQEIIKNLIDSVDRQAETATRNREAALGDMRALAPTDLKPERVDALNKATVMVPYEGEARLSKNTVNDYVKANGAATWGTDPKTGETLTTREAIARMYEVPGATDQDIEAYLKAQGKI